MSKISLKNKILERLTNLEGKWVHKGMIEERVKEWGYLADTGDRECRRLAEENLVQRKEENGSVSYRYSKEAKSIPVKPRVEIIIKEDGSRVALLV